MGLKKNKKRIFIVAFVVMLFCITVGYASIATGLFINGTTEIPSSSWNVHFANLAISEGSAVYSTETYPYQPVTLNENDTSISYSVSLFRPGDYYEFTFDIVNEGSIDAKIESILKTVSSSISNYDTIFDYTIIDTDTNMEPARGDVLSAGGVRHLKLRLEYKTATAVEQRPFDEAVLTLNYRLNFVQV